MTPSNATTETAFSTFCSDAARGQIREPWSSRSRPFDPPALVEADPTLERPRRFEPFDPNDGAVDPSSHEVATLHEVTEPHVALVACRSSSQRLSFGEKSERVDRHDRGLEPLQLAKAGSIRDPASSISNDFGAGGSLRTPSLGPAPRTAGWAFAFVFPESGKRR